MKACFILLFLSTTVFGFQKEDALFIEGKVIGVQTKEPLYGADVYIEKSRIGIQTGKDGSYKLQIPDSLQNKKLIVICHYPGMNNVRKKVRLKNHSCLANFELEERRVIIKAELF